jgi:hypothetical protein
MPVMLEDLFISSPSIVSRKGTPEWIRKGDFMKVWAVEFEGIDERFNFSDKKVLGIFDSKEKATKFAEEQEKENKIEDEEYFTVVFYYVNEYEVK